MARVSWYSIFFVLTFVFVFGAVNKKNNVCRTFRDYATIRTNKNCWFNPDVNAKPSALAKHHGYKLENHEVITDDGYVLTLHRISKRHTIPVGFPVFIHHGIAMNSAFWMLKGKNSLAFQLVDYGFDIWLGNARGTEFSMKHVTLSISDPEFWDYSFHEMAVYDVPAAIDYIRDKTGRTKRITYIGHSMGTTISYIYSSIHPEHAKNNVNMLISIAPIAFLSHVRSWLALGSSLHNVIERESRDLGLHGIGQYPLLKRMVKNFCSEFPHIQLCQSILESIVGVTLDQTEPEVMPLFFRRYPGSFSMKSIYHYAQQLEAGGKFQWFDYGLQENLIRYNSVKPPQYNIERIDVPVYLIYGEEDLLSTEDDVIHLFTKLKSPKYLKRFRGKNGTIIFNHNDFVYSKHINDFNQFLSEIIRNVTKMSTDNFEIK